MAVYKNEDELMNTNWSTKINEAQAAGDYKLAAQYEQARNDKINSSNYTGNQTTTNNYAGWLDTTDYSSIGWDQMNSGASAEDVLDTYKKRIDKASNTVGMEKFVNDEHSQAMLDYILANQEVSVAPSYSFDYSSRPSYASNYSAKIDAMLDQILNRDKFSYDVGSDPLYQQYASMYQREGNRAMNDTLAAAASNAGGMNSYAVSAAQQANNYYASQLGDKIPELYQLAYEMYLQDLDNQVRDLGLLQSMDDTQYSRYRDTMSDWENDRNFAYNMYRDDVGDYQWDKSFDYTASQDAIDNEFRQNQFDWNVSTDQRDYDYNVGRDQVTDAWRDEEWQHQVAQDALAADQWQQAFDAENSQWQQAFNAENSGGSGGAGGGSGGGSGGSGGSDDTGSSDYAGNEGISEDKILLMQKAVGAEQDGKWGPDSKNRSGGMSATEAWEAYQAGTLKPAGGGSFTEQHKEAVSASPDRNSGASTGGLSASGKKVMSALSMMYDSISNQYKDEDGDYPVEKSIYEYVNDGTITADDGVILMNYFGYNASKWFE